MNARQTATTETIEMSLATPQAPVPAKQAAPAVVEQQAVSDAPGSDIAFIQMIERVSRAPDVRMDVLQGLVAMRNDELQRVAKRAYIIAMAAAQGEMEPVRREATNTQTKSKYATYDALDTAIRPIYTRHGFSIRYDTGDAPRDLEVRVIAKIAHKDGYEELLHLDIPADGKGAKGGEVMTRTHAVMSAVSYGKRGLLGMGFNIATTDKRADDDGNAAGGAQYLSDEQIAELRQLIIDVNADLPKLLAYLKVERLEDIYADKFEDVKRVIEQKRTKKA